MRTYWASVWCTDINPVIHSTLDVEADDQLLKQQLTVL
jgi:hypothetical protein